MAKAKGSPGTAMVAAKSNLPTDWKKDLAQYAQRAEATAEQQIGNWMSVRGGRLQYKGAEVQDSTVDAIILDVMMENAYYEDSFDPDNPTPPTCFAIGYEEDEMAPHDNSAAKQNANCATCEWNKFGTGGISGRGKACKNQLRVALLSADNITEDGIIDAQIARLRVPVTSVASLKSHINNIKSKLGTAAPFVTVTRIEVSPDDKTQVKVDFGFPDPKKLSTFPDRVMPAIISRVKEAEKQLAEPYNAVSPEDAARTTRPAKARKGKAARHPANTGAKKGGTTKPAKPAPSSKKPASPPPAAEGKRRSKF